jgi:hypothetical protein
MLMQSKVGLPRRRKGVKECKEKTKRTSKKVDQRSSLSNGHKKMNEE